MPMRKKTHFLLVITLILLLPGCWDSQDLNELAIVLGAAVDSGEQGYIVSVQATKTAASQGGTEESGGDQGFFISSAQGGSVFEAARNLTLDLHLRNYWPHTQIVVIGEELARESILSVVEFFARDPKRRLSAYFVVGSGMGLDYLKNQPENAELSSREIKEIIQLTRANGFGIDLDLREFIKEMEGLSGASIMNKVKSVPLQITDGEDNQGAKKKTSALEGVGVFYDYMLLGYLSPEETRNINFLRDNVGSWVIETNFTGGTKGEITSELNNSKISFTPFISEDGIYIIKAKLSVAGKIVEYVGKEPLGKIDISKIEDKFAEDIKREIKQTFTRVQRDYQVDIFNIGDIFTRKYEFLLDLEPYQWNKIFSENMHLDLDVEFKINYPGIKINSARKLEE